jgi:catalase
MQEFGKLRLTKNPENFHRDVEQAAFSPGAMVPGIEDSPDPLLQFRMFFYRDAQYHRLGSTNYHQIPVNCPFMAKSFSSLNFDGTMRVDANHAGNPDYNPNSFDPVSRFRTDVAETPYKVADNIVSRKSHFHHEGKLSEYDQPRELYERVMTQEQRDHLHKNTAVMMEMVSVKEIKVRYLAQQWQISKVYAKGIYDNLKTKDFELHEVAEMAKGAEMMTHTPKFKPSQETDRLVGLPVRGVYNE